MKTRDWWFRHVCTFITFCWATSYTYVAVALQPTTEISQYVHDDWSRKDGLPEGAVYSIYQSQKGFLWVGTKSSLVRFDGRDFTSYKPGENGLSQYSFVRQIVETKEQRIFAGVIGGVLSLENGRFSQFDDSDGLKHPFVYAMALGKNGDVWVGSGGAGVWKLKNGRYTQHPAYRSGALPGQVNDLLVLDNGDIWVATDQGIVILGKKASHITDAEGLPSSVVNVLFRANDGSVLVGTRSGLVKLRTDGTLIHSISTQTQTENITAVLIDSDGQLWYGTYDGYLRRVVLDGERSVLVDSIKCKGSVFALLEDSMGSIWVGTDEGLERFTDALFISYGEAEGLPEEQILNVAPHQQGGIVVLDGNGSVYLFDKGVVQIVAPPGTITGEGMLGIGQTNDGSIYVGGPTLRRFKDGAMEEYQQPGGEFVVVVPDGNNLLLAQTEPDGRSVISRFSNGRFSPIFIDVSLNHVQRIFKDSNGNIWISTGGNGVVRINKNGSVDKFTSENGLPHNIAYTFVEDKRGQIWVTTRSSIARIGPDGVKTVPGSEGVGLRNSPVHLIPDDAGNVFVTTDDGVFHVELADLDRILDSTTTSTGTNGATNDIRSKGMLSLRLLSQDSGLRGRDISWRPNGVARARDGRIWLATNRGLSVVNPGEIRPLPAPTNVFVDEMIVDGRVEPVSESEMIIEGRKQIAFHYTAPALIAAGTQVFQYRLVGYDDNWVNVGQRTNAYYTNVPPGKFRFEVRVTRPGNTTAAISTPLVFKILPKWYETTVARVGIGFLFLCCVAGIYWLRIRHLKTREAYLKKLVDQRTDELQQVNEQLEQRVSDRTQQLQVANTALADEKERLATTLRNLAEGVISIDCHHQVLLINDVAQRLFDCRDDTVLGEPIENLFSLRDRFSNEPVKLPLDRFSCSEDIGLIYVSQAVLVLGEDKKQEHTLVDISISSILDHDAAIVGAVIVIADVTAKTKAEEGLQKTHKLEAIGVLAGGIAHDFNNLITGIVGYMDLALRIIGKDHLAGKWLSNSVEIADNARNLTQQLLTFSSGGSPATASHSLKALLEQSTQFVLSGSKISVEMSVVDELWPCDVDPQQMRQVFDNLIINARQAMPGGGNLAIEMSNVIVGKGHSSELSEGRYVSVQLRDCGDGIPLDIQSQIFDPFFSTKESGTGLGLATVHSIIRKHGGSIELLSAKGEGSTFTVLLRAADTAPVSSKKYYELPNASANRNKILVMDDDPNIRRITKVALENYGYQVFTATDGDHAERLFREAQNDCQPFVLAIVDLTIPGGKGGADTLQTLKDLDDSLPVIASSGYSQEEVLSKTSEYQFDGLLPKPYTVSMLVSEVSKYISKRNRPSGK